MKSINIWCNNCEKRGEEEEEEENELKPGYLFDLVFFFLILF